MKASSLFVVGAVLVAIVSLVACGGGAAEPKAQAAAPAQAPVVDVAVVKAQSGTIEAVLELSGNLAPQARVGVKPRVPGAIEKLLVDIGTPVREGQTIAARMAFIEAYERELTRARTEQAPVHWLPSVGHDTAQRAGALQEAERKGRISSTHARGLDSPITLPDPSYDGGCWRVRSGC